MMTLKKFKRMKTVRVVIADTDDVGQDGLHVSCPVPIKFHSRNEGNGYDAEVVNTPAFWVWYAGSEVTDDWQSIYDYAEMYDLLSYNEPVTK